MRKIHIIIKNLEKMVKYRKREMKVRMWTESEKLFWKRENEQELCKVSYVREYVRRPRYQD